MAESMIELSPKERIFFAVLYERWQNENDPLPSFDFDRETKVMSVNEVLTTASFRRLFTYFEGTQPPHFLYVSDPNDVDTLAPDYGETSRHVNEMLKYFLSNEYRNSQILGDFCQCVILVSPDLNVPLLSLPVAEWYKSCLWHENLSVRLCEVKDAFSMKAMSAQDLYAAITRTCVTTCIGTSSVQMNCGTKYLYSL